MIDCPNCGHQNPEGFKFCGNCAAPLVPAAAAREQRKTVTVLFCDVTGSTSLGESVDPEALRALLARYFERMKGIVEAHGGTVEKFIGDAVMAVFGVPQVHEDDALRAVRAAIEMRDALPELGIQARIGINTGEVVTGTSERLATGDAVNVAARLQQAAAPQEILIGQHTFALVEAVINAQEVEPLTLRGKAQPVLAYRLAGLTGTPARRDEAAMVGRVTELRRLRDAYNQATLDQSCQLFTVLGNAGVGKSRLIHEFLDGLDDATVVTGTCLSYGEGITYWPVIDVVRQLTATRPTIKLDENLVSLLGEASFTAPSDQIAWAFRKLVEDTARERPLVVVFDDLQWAEPKFLDLIEHIADLSRDSPILLLCMARPDLLDRRSTWAGGKLNATNLLLEPLSGQESVEMVGRLAGGLSDQASRRVVEAAEGNPLFVEEMVALVRASGDENVRVPATIHALLAARLDQLDAHERQVLEGGSIEGRLFHRDAVEALYPEEKEVAARLTALVRKDLVRPDKSELPGSDAFRFRHLLIRDAAYDALPKATRAVLHERFARWLEEFGADVPEIDEILGYHLEQSCRYKTELGQAVEPAVATRARDRLAKAGRRALARGDQNAAENLLRRAGELPLEIDVTIQNDETTAAFWGIDGTRAYDVAQRHLELALAAGDRAAELCSRMQIEFLNTFLNPAGAAERLSALAEEGATLFDATGNLRGMYAVYLARAQVANMLCDVAAVLGNFEAATDVSHRLGLGNEFIAPRANWRIPSAEPNTKSLEWFATEAAGYHAAVDECRAEAQAMAGNFDEARKLLDDELQFAEAMGGPQGVGGILAFEKPRVAILAGDYDAAVAAGEKGVALLEESGNTSIASTGAGILARAQFYAGHPDMAMHWAGRAEELGDPEDVYTHLMLWQVMGLVLAQHGEAEEAEGWLLKAVASAESTHSPTLLGDAYLDMGTSYQMLGKREDAASAYRHALAQYEAKENVVMAERTRRKIAELDA
ncbi:MAG TPA: adenylate/guanylate cyclase domain-containing protein [Candidatus Limnocylindrales bacterium]